MEHEPSSLPPQERKTNTTTAIEVYALDTKWWEEFRQIGLFEAFDLLEGNGNYREEQKKAFLSGEIENPTLDYPKIDLEKLNNLEGSLLDLKQRIIQEEVNPAVREAYRWKINEKIATLRMLRATAQGDMRRFSRWSEFIYGRPSLEIFTFTVAEIREEALEALNDPSQSEETKQAAQKLLEVLPQLEAPEITLPESQVFEQAKQNTEMILKKLVPQLPELEEFDAPLIQEAFEEALEKLQAEGWRVIIDEQSGKTGISVVQENQEVKIPSKRKTKKEKLISLILHEIGTHVKRRLEGERSRLQLLGAGLDRYEGAEEGIATMREQATKTSMKEYAGQEGHLAISLALGLDGQPRNFREVFRILEALFYFRNLKRGRSPEESQKKAQTSAWNRCIRTFRGTDCKTRGACFTKDIIYREGNIAIWKLIKVNPEAMVLFELGKLDPTNLRHLVLLSILGISDQDLQEN